MNIKLILRYLTNNVLLQLLGIIFSGASVKMLTLSELGLFNLAKSLAGSFQYTHLGLRYSLDRFLPEGNTDSNTKILHITIIVNSIISFLLFIFYCFLYKFNFFLLCYILGGWLFATFSLIRVYNRGIGQLNYFVYLTFISNMLVIVIPFTGLYFKGEKGLFLGYMCITFFLLIKYFPKELFNIKFVFNKIDFIKQ